MAEINDETMDEIEDAFALFDQNGDGKLAYKDIPRLLRALGLNPSGTDIEKVLEDYKSEGRIELETFLPIYSDFRKIKPPVKEDFIEGFKIYDREEKGVIDSANFRSMLCNRGDSRLTEEEANVILEGFEDHSKGEVNYNQLIDHIMAE